MNAVSQGGNAVSVKPANLNALLVKNRQAIEAALPRHLSADRLLRIALTEVRKNPDLGTCEPMSFLGAVVQAAQLGLEPGSALGHAYLVPFHNKRTGRREVQMIPGYRGFIDLARRSGQILSISAKAVYDCDHFVYSFGLSDQLEHKPASLRPKGAQLIAVYSIARLKDGGHQFEVMSRDEIEAIRKRSKAADSGPWSTDYEAMAIKSVVRKLFKFLPVSVEIQKAVSLDEAASVGLPQDNALLVLSADEPTDNEKPVLAELTQKFSEEGLAKT